MRGLIHKIFATKVAYSTTNFAENSMLNHSQLFTTCTNFYTNAQILLCLFSAEIHRYQQYMHKCTYERNMRKCTVECLRTRNLFQGD